VNANLQIGGLDRSSGDNVNCVHLFFGAFSMENTGDRCAVTFTRFDDELWEGTYEANLSRTRLDGTSYLDVTGSFRMPPAYEAE
jgi:hypothetical protein